MNERSGAPILSCKGCGVCCEEQGLPPRYLVPALLIFLPRRLREEIAHHQAEERRTGITRNSRGLPCIWFDAATRRCRHYSLRPDVCREVPVGGASCLFWRERRIASPGQAPAPPLPIRWSSTSGD